MATVKKGVWTPQEVAQLMLIPKDSNSFKALTKIAKTFKRSYATTYQKWHSELQKLKVNSPAPKHKDIPAMDLAYDPNFEATNSRIDEVEVISLKKSLDAHLPKLEVLKGAITIPARLEKVAKEHFPTLSPKLFAVQAISGNSKFKRVVRKF